MEIDQVNTAQLTKLQKLLEQIAGNPVDLSGEKLINWTYPAASHDYQDGEVTFRNFIRPGKFCSDMRLIDVSGNSQTADDGTRVFLLSDFVCTQQVFAQPVDLVATPRSATPCYTTAVLSMVPSTTFQGFFSDVQITLYTWSPDGSPAPDVSVDWRCRIPAPELIL